MEFALASCPVVFSPFALSGPGVLLSLPREQPHNKGGLLHVMLVEHQ